MEQKEIVINVNKVVTRLSEVNFSSPLSWKINKKEQWAIIGPNGAGKTILAGILQKKYALKEGSIEYQQNKPITEIIKSISFKDIYSLADCRSSYYQQRWHSTETEDVPLVRELVKPYLETEKLSQLLSLFKVEELLSKRLIFLSSGELRKFLIIRALLTEPQILILGNPFIGLDAISRPLLVEMLHQMTELKELQIILLLSNPQDIPDMITHVLPIKDKTCYPPQSRTDFLNNIALINELFEEAEQIDQLPALEITQQASHHSTFKMENVFIRYGERTILKELNWEVKNGEKWALTGPNGSGKSTLLSLVYADNPQSYANSIWLFDKKRGTGESIWDIKKRIGYVSPEMHLYYRENVPVIQIVGSGFFDSVGLYRKCNKEQEGIALKWMKIFGVEKLKDRLFLTLSSGEQRLVLLARAFVKNPDLLVLDEPLHGLDISNKKKIIHLIDKFCQQQGKTLIYVTHYLNELPPCIKNKFELTKHN